MKTRLSLLVAGLVPVFLLVAAFTQAPTAPASPEIGAAAPAFTLQGADGETYTLADFEGQHVVLEWLNFGCPYVKKHYSSGNMQALQSKYAEEGVVWLSVVSSAPGKQGYYPADEMMALNAEQGGQQMAILLDPEGTVGRAYGARTTPHMYIIDAEGTLVYKGGIDDKPTADPSDIEGATNHVSVALDAALAGEEIPVTTTPPYGCSVKYAAAQ
ncbi:MAG: thioredoxin family protein [Bacteroidota bacterium]